MLINKNVYWLDYDGLNMILGKIWMEGWIGKKNALTRV
jgi:hypothetical protein